MASKKTGLGRGLGSLFEDLSFDPAEVSITETEENNGTAEGGNNNGEGGGKSGVSKAPSKKAQTKAEAAESIVYISIADIKPNSKQPRKIFNEEALQELADSITEHGVITPILVRPAAKGYELVAGERRWRAARKAGLKKIPAIVRDIDDKQNSFYALIENMQREDLNIIEEALGIQRLMDEYSLTQDEAAKAVGKSRPYVTNALRLLKLPEEVQNLVTEKKLSAGAARAIAGLEGSALQIEAALKAVAEGWSVRKIESYTGNVKSKKPGKKKAKRQKDSAVKDVEEKLSGLLGTKVTISGSDRLGKLEIEYYSREELDKIIETLSALED